ncbi:MAG: MMPL family transporter [Thermoplasmata archaeon]|nr:MAG: MMPL family transporter [Thermoplasmata archaeon]
MAHSEWERYKLEEEEEEGGEKPDSKDRMKQKEKKGRIGEDNSVRKLDLYLDKALSRVTGTYEKSTDKIGDLSPKVKSRMIKVASTSSDKIKKMEEKSDEYTSKFFRRKFSDSILDKTVKYPKIIIIIVLILTAAISYFGIAPKEMGGADFRSKIHGEFEVYLPQEHETKLILDEINEDFSTNLIIVLIQTNNSKDVDDPGFGYGNVLDRAVLMDMDRLERNVDFDMEDSGEEDGVKFVFSISTVIKVANSTPPRFWDAVQEELEIDFDFVDARGEYSIPDQAMIDRLMSQMPEDSLKSIIRDTNDDGIYDTAAIVIGITNEVDQEEIVAKMNYYADTASSSEMTVTGPIPMTLRITGRTYEEFLKVLPAAVILVGAVLVLFHRNFKILLITGLPVMCSLGVTYGFLGLAVPILTPQVVLIAPILIALGVAYGLYIANRYADEKDIKDPEERIKKAVKTTGRAVFLSAATTAIGFSSLIFMELIPLKVIGIGLSTGIMVCYVITILTVPSLIMALRYEKKIELKAKEKIGNIPVRNRKKIIAVGLSVTIISFGMLGAGMVTANMDFIKMAPQDEEVIKKMHLYSDIFGGGQPGMILIKGSPESGDSDIENKDSMRDYDVLLQIEALELEINGDEDNPYDEGIENANAMGIVDIMKMIKVPPLNISESLPPFVPDEIADLVQNLEERLTNVSFWDALELVSDDEIRFLGKSPQQMMINIFYNSLTMELRSVFVSSDYSRSILIIEMPALDVIETERAVNEINQATEDLGAGKSTTHLTGFAAVIVAVNQMLVFNSVASTILALVFVFIILAFIFRSIKYSALTLIPVSLVVAWQPALLVMIGGLGKWINPADPFFTGDLNLFTAIIGSIIVGIGIDFGVHMTERIRERGETVESVKHGVATSGMSFVEATATTMAGLSAVFLILIPAIQEFIILVMLLLLCSVLGAIFILPAIYTIIFRMRAAKLAASGQSSEEGGMDQFEPGSESTSMSSERSEEAVESDSDIYGTEA